VYKDLYIGLKETWIVNVDPVQLRLSTNRE